MNPQRYVPFELPQQLAPRPFTCLTQGHYAQQEAAQALLAMLGKYTKAARSQRKNRGPA